ncbi:DUF3667 domain-containing protein [Fibrella aquatilis]|uniref:DUF3667 domain-containing protein n=1 Tax=Fibrella aquatilis TaxID=2817059 RepID=A0A939JYJ7_9BACT|nr:DUF3667 domain-containing protein [Fibrella aquatilis]MBO0929936.1 DUF3667 domain-containing protein [Fibrella aquatilis]
MMTTTQYEIDKATTCSNCGTDVTAHFCGHCGKSAKLERIDKHYISHEISHLFHFEKGLFYTVKELFTRPGDSIKEFIAENRSKHMKPVAFLILTSLLYTVVAHYSHAEEFNNSSVKLDFGKSAVGSLLHWMQTHYGYANIMMVVFTACCVKLLFRKYSYNLFEIMVLLCFVMGQGMLLATLVSCFYKLVSPGVYMNLFLASGFIYPAWAVGQFFDKTKITNYLKAFAAYVLGSVLFYTALIFVGLATDLLIKAH